MAVENVADKAAGLGLPGVVVDGLDPVAVYETVAEAAVRARNGEGPTVIEAKVVRMTPHSSDDDDRSYRPKEEMEALKTMDPLADFAAQLRKKKVLTETIEVEMEAQVKELIEEAVRLASEAPYPDVAEATYPVYAEDIING